MLIIIITITIVIIIVINDNFVLPEEKTKCIHSEERNKIYA